MKIISISIGEESLNLIEKYCDINSLNRSSFFIKSALKQIGEINDYVKQENKNRSSNSDTSGKPNRDRNKPGKERKTTLEGIKGRDKKRRSGSSAIQPTNGKSGNRKKVTGKTLPGKGE